MFQTKVVETIKKHISCSNFFFPVVPFMRQCRKILYSLTVIDNKLIQCMRFASWITETIITHSEYVILIAFPLQQWLPKLVSMLHYKYIASPVSICYLIRSL
jgi:hypothetical protein